MKNSLEIDRGLEKILDIIEGNKTPQFSNKGEELLKLLNQEKQAKEENRKAELKQLEDESLKIKLTQQVNKTQKALWDYILYITKDKPKKKKIEKSSEHKWILRELGNFLKNFFKDSFLEHEDTFYLKGEKSIYEIKVTKKKVMK